MRLGPCPAPARAAGGAGGGGQGYRQAPARRSPPRRAGASSPSSQAPGAVPAAAAAGKRPGRRPAGGRRAGRWLPPAEGRTESGLAAQARAPGGLGVTLARGPPRARAICVSRPHGLPGPRGGGGCGAPGWGVGNPETSRRTDSGERGQETEVGHQTAERLQLSSAFGERTSSFSPARAECERACVRASVNACVQALWPSAGAGQGQGLPRRGERACTLRKVHGMRGSVRVPKTLPSAWRSLRATFPGRGWETVRSATGPGAEPGKAGSQRKMVRENLGTSGQLHLALSSWRPGSFLPKNIGRAQRGRETGACSEVFSKTLKEYALFRVCQSPNDCNKVPRH